ncbi:bifunctional peptidase and arginyl-hydroxylase JMJD5-like [Diadema antillarum]|uniref:bifunctional peptidase and arginyl-hydroxylase JMJD5-like n=1 Tax=Diadema antillarum TaxID=105358 RepID=UPI003A87E920
MEAMRAVTAQRATCLLVTIMCLNALVGMTYSEVNEPLKDDGADLQDVPHRDRESLDEVQPPGHLKPLGSHRPPEMPGVDVLERVPDPPDFFSRYVEAGRPAVFKGAAKEMASYRLWTDEYLSGRYGDLIVEVEEGKKENRSKDLWRMPLSKFIKSYRQEDVYLVTDVPEEMGDDFCLLRCLLCGGFTDVLVDTILWYSSGGTKSVLHFDSLDNINCVMDGRKDIFLVDKREKDNVHIDHPEGSFSGVDVDRVDFQKYPGLAKVPWYNVTLERGDCLFIPYRWFHSVRSSGRNLAINVWFIHQVWFNTSDCPGDLSQLPDYLPLSKVTTRGNRLEPLRSDIAVEIQSNEGSISLAQLTELDTLFQEPIQEKIPQVRQ